MATGNWASGTHTSANNHNKEEAGGGVVRRRGQGGDWGSVVVLMVTLAVLGLVIGKSYFTL